MASLLRFIAVCLAAVVAVGFALFAVDELDRGSKTQQHAIERGIGIGREMVVPPAPAPKDEVIRERQQGKVREAIDDANDVLLLPFTGVVASSNSNWVTHGVPALLALFLYGVGLGLLANMLPRRETHAGDWRTA
jgi:hypothetical protein